ncbi:MAG: hypothetical protein ABH838_00020, partial [Actinomycetota bacterium]
EKISEGSPNVLDHIKKDEIDLIINTPWGRGTRTDGYFIRTAASYYGVPLITTLSAAQAAIQGIEAMKNETYSVKAIQDYHKNQKPKTKNQKLRFRNQIPKTKNRELRNKNKEQRTKRGERCCRIRLR